MSTLWFFLMGDIEGSEELYERDAELDFLYDRENPWGDEEVSPGLDSSLSEDIYEAEQNGFLIIDLFDEEEK